MATRTDKWQFSYQQGLRDPSQFIKLKNKVLNDILNMDGNIQCLMNRVFDKKFGVSYTSNINNVNIAKPEAIEYEKKVRISMCGVHQDTKSDARKLLETRPDVKHSLQNKRLSDLILINEEFMDAVQEYEVAEAEEAEEIRQQEEQAKLNQNSASAQAGSAAAQETSQRLSPDLNSISNVDEEEEPNVDSERSAYHTPGGGPSREHKQSVHFASTPKNQARSKMDKIKSKIREQIDVDALLEDPETMADISVNYLPHSRTIAPVVRAPLELASVIPSCNNDLPDTVYDAKTGERHEFYFVSNLPGSQRTVVHEKRYPVPAKRQAAAIAQEEAQVRLLGKFTVILIVYLDEATINMLEGLFHVPLMTLRRLCRGDIIWWILEEVFSFRTASCGSGDAFMNPQTLRAELHLLNFKQGDNSLVNFITSWYDQIKQLRPDVPLTKELKMKYGLQFLENINKERYETQLMEAVRTQLFRGEGAELDKVIGVVREWEAYREIFEMDYGAKRLSISESSTRAAPSRTFNRMQTTSPSCHGDRRETWQRGSDESMHCRFCKRGNHWTKDCTVLAEVVEQEKSSTSTGHTTRRDNRQSSPAQRGSRQNPRTTSPGQYRRNDQKYSSTFSGREQGRDYSRRASPGGASGSETRYHSRRSEKRTDSRSGQHDNSTNSRDGGMRRVSASTSARTSASTSRRGRHSAASETESEPESTYRVSTSRGQRVSSEREDSEYEPDFTYDVYSESDRE